MTLNRSAARTDLPYLRRRIKPGAPAVEPVHESVHEAAERAPSAGLDLRHPVPAATASVPAPAPAPARARQPEPFAAPAIDEVRELGAEHPLLRLDARRSAIGSLIVAGASAIAWESSDLVTGAITLTSSGIETVGTPVMTAGNRALVGFHNEDGVVALRHLHALRRALFVGNGSEPITVLLFDGSTVSVPAEPASRSSASDGTRMLALTLLRVGSLIELRAEPVFRGLSPAELHRHFGYQMTARVDVRQTRTR